jgi:hypothetical protein
MLKFGIVCFGILLVLLSFSTLAAFHLPWYQALGLSLFGGMLAAVLGTAIEIAIVDKKRGDDHEH